MARGTMVRVSLLAVALVLVATGNWMIALAGLFVVELGYFLAKAIEQWSAVRAQRRRLA